MVKNNKLLQKQMSKHLIFNISVLFQLPISLPCWCLKIIETDMFLVDLLVKHLSGYFRMNLLAFKKVEL